MSLSSRLARAGVRGPIVLPPPRSASLPRRSRQSTTRPVPRPDHQVRPDVQAALARFVDDEAPLARVERLAVLAERNQARTEDADETLVPGNCRTGSKAELALGLARSRVGRQMSLTQVPPAIQMWAMRAQGMSASDTLGVGAQGVPARADVPAVDLGACTSCGGPLRVAMVDLSEGEATLECIACGLRRVETHDAASPSRDPDR